MKGRKKQTVCTMGEQIFLYERIFCIQAIQEAGFQVSLFAFLNDSEDSPAEIPSALYHSPGSSTNFQAFGHTCLLFSGNANEKLSVGLAYCQLDRKY
jgi:hypothetical protein